MILPSCKPARDSEINVSCLADWGVRVTVCIAALCEDRKKIVIVSDNKVSFGDFSGDRAVFKMEVFFAHWITLFAGDDIEQIPFIIERAHEVLSTARRRKASAPGPAQVASAIQRAYDERLNAQIEAKVLRRFGYSAKSFQQDGKRRCTATVYNGLCSKISNVNLSLRFLIAGFDEKRKGHILVAGGEEAPRDYTPLGFMAIGSGANAALSSMIYHREKQHLSPSISQSQCVYIAAAAKFMAESASNVGDKSTTIAVIGSDDSIKPVMDWEPIKQIWKREGAPRLPENLDSRISPLIIAPDEAVEKALKRLEALKQ